MIETIHEVIKKKIVWLFIALFQQKDEWHRKANTGVCSRPSTTITEHATRHAKFFSLHKSPLLRSGCWHQYWRRHKVQQTPWRHQNRRNDIPKRYPAAFDRIALHATASDLSTMKSWSTMNCVCWFLASLKKPLATGSCVRRYWKCTKTSSAT